MNAAAMVIALTQMGVGVRQGAVLKLHVGGRWHDVLDLAVRHRVAPLLWCGLASAGPGAAPEPVAAQLEAKMWQATATRMLCEHALGRLLETLATHGIEVLVLKGAALAHEYYPRPELRPYHDLDVLCRPSDYPALARVLLTAGYRCDDPVEVARHPRRYEGSRRRSFTAPCGDVEIEVHLDVLGLGLAPRHQDDFWSSARTLETGSLRLRTLAPLYQLLHLAVHVHTHCYSRLIWLIDLDLLVRRHGDSLDWVRATALARDEGIGAVLRHVLATAHAVLGTPLPALPPPTLEERCLALCYRKLWPLATVTRLGRREHRRLLRFQPGTGDLRDVVFSAVLLGRRREKWAILCRSGWHRVGA